MSRRSIKNAYAKTEDGADVVVLPDATQHHYYQFRLQREEFSPVGLFLPKFPV